VLAPFPLETNRFFSGWELSEVKKGSLTGGVGGDSCQISRSSSGPTSFWILRRDRFEGLYHAIGVFTFSGLKTNWRKQICQNPELVNLFFIHVLDELIGCTFDVLACRDRTPDNKNIGIGFQRILNDIHPHATGCTGANECENSLGIFFP